MLPVFEEPESLQSTPGKDVFVGYTPESAQEEELEAFVVDDITWWVCTKDMTRAHKDRLTRILREYRPWIAQSVDEMRHCSPELAYHRLEPRPDAKWRLASSWKLFPPPEFDWIRGYVQQLLNTNPPIISPTENAFQTSNVTLAPKPAVDGKPNYRLCINYVWLNNQCYKAVWEIRNLDDVLRCLGGNLRYTSIDGFSGFYIIPLSDDSKILTAFVIPG